MLVLTRKVGESIRINDDISITIVKIQGNRVRIGVEAPSNVRIVRSEIPPQQQSATVTPIVPNAPLASFVSSFLATA